MANEDINVGAISEALNNKVDLNQLNTNAQGLSYGSGWGMPSSKYIDLQLGASGTTYTAPANGWFVIRATATSTYAFMNLSNHNSAIEHISDLTNKDDQCGLFVPAKKGDTVGLWYINFALTGSTDRFRFVYAEGEI